MSFLQKPVMSLSTRLGKASAIGAYLKIANCGQLTFCPAGFGRAGDNAMEHSATEARVRAGRLYVLHVCECAEHEDHEKWICVRSIKLNLTVVSSRDHWSVVSTKRPAAL